MKYIKIFLFLSIIIFSCNSGSINETTETEAIDVSNLETEDVLDEILALDELMPENVEELEEINADELTAKSAEPKVKPEAEKDKSEELKIEEKKIEEKRVEVIKEKATESPLKGKNCDEILKIFEGVTSGSTVVDYDIMNDPYFVICKNKGALEEEFAKVEEDDIDEEPW